MNITLRNKQIYTCKSCDKRSIGCHTTCKAYIAERKALDEINSNKQVRNYINYTTQRNIERF